MMKGSVGTPQAPERVPDVVAARQVDTPAKVLELNDFNLLRDRNRPERAARCVVLIRFSGK